MTKKTIANMAVVLTAENAKLRSQLDKSQKDIARFRNKASRSIKGFSSDFKAALAGIGAFQLGRGLIGTLRETEVQFAQLKTATGSLDEANRAFQDLEKFAARTPFALEQSVSAFVKIKNLGLDPSIDALESYGNTASAMGKDLNQFIEAVADAATGEFERLKEFGIKAKSQGDQVSLTFRGVTTTIQKSAADIEGYLRNIGNVEFGGAMEERAQTLDGALSNLGDSFSSLARSIGKAGVTELLNDTARGMSAVANAIPDLATALKAYGQAAEDANSVEEINAQLAKRRLRLGGRMSDSRRAQIQEQITELEERRDKLTAAKNQAELDRRNEEELFGPFDDREQIAAANYTPPPPPKPPTGRSGLSEAQKELNRLLKEGRDLTESLYTPQEAYAAQIERLNQLNEKGAIGQDTYNRAVVEYQNQLDDATGKTERFADLQAIIAEVDPVAPLLDQLDALQALEAEYPKYADIIGEAMLDVHDEIDQINSGLDDQKDKAKEVEDAWSDLGPTFTSAFEDALVNGAKFSDLLKGIEQDIIRIATRNLITKPIGGAISDFFSPSGTGGGLLDGLFGFATGGSFTVGGSGGTDSQVVAFKATPGEQVTVRTPAQQQAVTSNYNFTFALPSDTVDYRRTGQMVAREAARIMSTAQAAV